MWMLGIQAGFRSLPLPAVSLFTTLLLLTWTICSSLLQGAIQIAADSPVQSQELPCLTFAQQSPATVASYSPQCEWVLPAQPGFTALQYVGPIYLPSFSSLLCTWTPAHWIIPVVSGMPQFSSRSHYFLPKCPSSNQEGRISVGPFAWTGSSLLLS